MSILTDLKKQKGVYIRCPHCAGDFKARSAALFDAINPLPADARELLEAQRRAIVEQREALATRMKGLEKTQIAARSVNVGKVVEKIATVLQGFPADPKDCRSLFDPIDLVVFDGMTRSGSVEAIHFVEIKSGRSRLNAHQRQVRDAVQAGKVEFGIDQVGKGTP